MAEALTSGTNGGTTVVSDGLTPGARAKIDWSTRLGKGISSGSGGWGVTGAGSAVPGSFARGVESSGTLGGGVEAGASGADGLTPGAKAKIDWSTRLDSGSGSGSCGCGAMGAGSAGPGSFARGVESSGTLGGTADKYSGESVLMRTGPSFIVTDAAGSGAPGWAASYSARTFSADCTMPSTVFGSVMLFFAA